MNENPFGNNWWILILIFIIIMSVIAGFKYNAKCCMCGDSNNKCCPCPNYKYINEVENWSGKDASSSYSWLEMCNNYKLEFNKTFECFEE